MRVGFVSRTLGASAVALAAWLATAASPAAGATQVRLFEEINEPRFFEVAHIVISADRSRNSIRVGFDRRREAFVIRDRERVQAPKCERLNDNAVRCSGDYELVFVDAGGGDDRVKIRSQVRAETDLSGEGGDDLLIGGRRNDVIEGGHGDDDVGGGPGDDDVDGDGFRREKGDDVMRGGGGDDSLGNGEYEPGRDIFLGGGGDDFCDAKDGRRDIRIDCGPGRDDDVRRDPSDPRPRRCENLGIP